MTLEPDCAPVHRPAKLYASASVLGLRAAQVTLDPTGPGGRIDVWLYRPPAVLAPLADAALWHLDGPRGAERLAIDHVDTDPAGPHCSVVFEGTPTNVRYRLSVDDGAGVVMDPLRRSLLVRMQPDCVELCGCSDLDIDAPVDQPSPFVDYTARDWRTLRSALIDHLVTLDPGADRSAADPTITVLEAIAHVGDVLHYRVDRVFTEATLESARLRTSVRRLARLVDYPLSDGVSADAFVHIEVQPDAAAGAGARLDRGATVSRGDRALPPDEPATTFTIDEGAKVRAALGEIALHDWSEDACCLPAGSTSCVLVRPRPLTSTVTGAWLAPGDHLVFEVVDPLDDAAHVRWAHGVAGNEWPDMAGVSVFREPRRSRKAQVVTLVATSVFVDPLEPKREFLHVTWRAADALVESYPVSIDRSRGLAEVTVARANIVRAHHGRAMTSHPIEPVMGASGRGAIGWPLDGAGSVRSGGPGLARDHHGRPRRLEVTVTLPSNTSIEGTYVPTLLVGVEAGSFPFVVETEDHQPPLLRFRTGAVGAELPVGAKVRATYEVGCGPAGMIPANVLRVFERASGAPATGITARNPVAAFGGRAPDDLADVRRDAPDAFVASLRRAVLPADHAAALESVPFVQRAGAVRQWSGSWPLVVASADLLASADDAAARAGLAALLESRRMVGTEVTLDDGLPVGLRIALEVCLIAGADPEESRQRILLALRPGTAARPGLFHPDRLRLGGSVHLSIVVATVARVPGVDAVELLEARRLTDPPGAPPDVLHFGPTELPVLDDDPARPDRGSFVITVRGGR